MSRSALRLAIVGVLAVLGLLAVLAFGGRWEGRHNADVQNAHMEAVYLLATAAGLDSARLDEYRLDSGFDCLLYHPAGLPRERSAYELCFSSSGRLVETIDRKTGAPRFASLREQPSRAAVRVAPARLVSILVRRGVFARDPRLKGVRPDPSRLPLTNGDLGAFLFPRPYRP